MSEKRVTSEFIANLIQLRDEMEKKKVQKSTMRINQFQVMPMSKRPLHKQVIMGHMPIY